MKSFIPAALASLVLTSCVLLTGKNSSRSIDNLTWITTNLLNESALNPAVVMDNCMKAQDYIKADAKERTSSKYASMGLYNGDKDVRINNWGTISTNGKNLFSRSTEWSVDLENDRDFTVKCIGDNLWEVVPGTSEGYGEFSDSTKYKTSFSLTGKDIDGFCIWKCRTEGTLTETGKYRADFSSGDDLTFSWSVANSVSGKLSYSLTYSGTFSSVIYVDGKQTDWCTVTYEKGSKKTAKTSLN